MLERTRAYDAATGDPHACDPADLWAENTRRLLEMRDLLCPVHQVMMQRSPRTGRVGHVLKERDEQGNPVVCFAPPWRAA